MTKLSDSALVVVVLGLGLCTPAFPAEDAAPPWPILVEQVRGSPLAVQFGTLAMEGAAYAWDFGDGTTASGPAPVHAYQLPGEYAVVVRMTQNERLAWGRRAIRLTNDGLEPDAQNVVGEITFSKAQVGLTSAQRASLDRALARLPGDRHGRVEIRSISGQTESPHLATERGASVQKYLLSKGVQRDRVKIQTIGECDHCVLDLPKLGEVQVVAIPSIKGPTFAPNSEYSHGSHEPRYRVWFGTDRQPVDPGDVTKGFSATRDTKLHYGRAYVRIPKTHVFGSLGSSWVARLWMGHDDRVTLRSIEGMRKEDYIAAAIEELVKRDAGKRNVLVYIHGYNNSFEEAAIRAAQIGADLKVEGITAFYSWPSKGTVRNYMADEATIQASEPFLEQFLISLAGIRPADRIDILAHSMGNRALLAVANILNRTNSKIAFGQIILAAPDVDAQTFRQLASAYPALSRRTTLYTSSKDWPVSWSSDLHRYPRAGYHPPVTLVNGIDTVMVSNLNMDILGHDYFGEAAEVLNDIYHLLTTGAAPKDRIRLMPQPSPPAATTHWAIQQ